MDKLQDLIINSKYAHTPMKIDEKDDASNRWNNKVIYDAICLYCSNTLENVTLNGLATLDLSNEYTHNNEMSLHFIANTKIENITPRSFPSIKIALDKINLEKYNRISLSVYPKAVGHVNFYFHFVFGDKGKQEIHAPSLTPNMWNNVSFEVGKISRSEVEEFSIEPFLMGCPPEGKPTLEVFISDIYAERVDEEADETWGLDDRIAYSHSGYYLNLQKTAITSVLDEEFFLVLNDKEEIV